MPPPVREVLDGRPSALRRYSVAALAAVLASAVRWLLDTTIGYHHPYSIFDLAVLLSAWYGGLGPGLLATVLGGVAIHFLSTLPGAPSDFLTGFEFYWIVCIAGCILIEAQRRAERKSAWNAAIAGERWRALVRETEQRQKAEAAARLAQDQFRLAFHHAPVGICQVAQDGRITEVNPEFCSITGWSRAELLQRRLFEILQLSDTDDDSDPSAGGESPAYIREKVYKRRDGATLWIRLAMSGFPCPGVRPQCGVGVLEDITARKRAEEELVQAQKVESVATLAGGIAHDFNNLLTAVLGNTALALQTVPEDAEVSRMLQGVVAAGERAARLTSQLLAYAGRGAVAPVNLDLSAVVESASELVRPSIPERIQLDLKLEGGLPPLRADASQIHQLITNLMLNAVEAVPEGRPGTVHVSTGRMKFEEPRDAAVGEVVPGEYLFVRVQDNGDGIEESSLPRIFDPFFTTRFLGRGLGLAAAAGIVRSLKGAVLVDTTPKVGSTFTVLFPIASHEPLSKIP
jgi:PAS domain S-box-containing protein